MVVITVFAVAPDRIDEMLEALAQADAADEWTGIGFTVAVDQAAGRLVGIGRFESEEALAALEDRVATVRSVMEIVGGAKVIERTVWREIVHRDRDD